MKESIFARAKKAREDKKGFTLVELIVVLVILAILAAILVPALLGWINKAKEKQIVLNARNAYLACQTVVSEDYAKATNNQTVTTTIPTELMKEVYNIAEVADGSITEVVVENHKVKGLTYTESKKKAVLEDGDWVVSDASTPSTS